MEDVEETETISTLKENARKHALVRHFTIGLFSLVIKLIGLIVCRKVVAVWTKR